MRQFIVLSVLLPLCACINAWQPVLPADVFQRTQSETPSVSSLVAQQYQQPGLKIVNNQCSLYKVGFTQDLYFQYIQYKTFIPELKEFTLCYWSKYYNHSNDHPIFSYAVEDQTRAILTWVSNTQRASYFSLSVHGHTLYRLNYPLRLNRWYHTCQSWNGRTGEWQIWVNAERVGRGFLNRLVDHVIPSGGIAITGQEQTQYGGGFLEGDFAPKGAGGMLGEITMLQLYSVALTAGKAQYNYKHHHAHTYDHNGNLITTTIRPATTPRVTPPTHPLLIGGQLNQEAALNIASGRLAGRPQPQVVPGQSFAAQLLNGQFIHNPLVEQYNSVGRGPQTFANQGGAQMFGIQSNSQDILLQLQRPQTRTALQQQLLQQNIQAIPSESLLPTPGPPLLSGELIHNPLTNPLSVQYIDGTQLETHQLFKRGQTGEDTVKSVEPSPSSNEESESAAKDEDFGKRLTPKTKRTTQESSEASDEKAEDEKDEEESEPKSKRQLYLGTFGSNDFLGDAPIFQQTFEQSLLYGLAGIGHNEPIIKQQKREEDREPAEAEVTAVMNVCSGCEQEPFERALVFGWRTVAKKLYSGAYYMPAVTQCRLF